jgi:hypothetical protein
MIFPVIIIALFTMTGCLIYRHVIDTLHTMNILRDDHFHHVDSDDEYENV